MDINKAYELINAKLNLWLREFIRLLPNLAIAALVLVLRISCTTGEKTGLRALPADYSSSGP